MYLAQMPPLSHPSPSYAKEEQSPGNVEPFKSLYFWNMTSLYLSLLLSILWSLVIVYAVAPILLSKTPPSPHQI